MSGSWAEHPDAVNDDAGRPAVDGVREATPAARVVGLGAICDLGKRDSDAGRSQSFSGSEFVLLENGRRVILHKDRGFTLGSRTGVVRGYETRDSITRDVLSVVLPDDDGCPDQHPWSWLAELARARGLDVTAEALQGLPYEVVLTDSVTGWLAPP